MSDAALNQQKTADAIAVIDSAIARLLGQVDSLKFAKSILAEDIAPKAELAAQPAPQQPTPASEPEPARRRKREKSAAVLERNEQIRKLVNEGIFTGDALAKRLGTKVHNVYLALSDMGISLRDARKAWEDKNGPVEIGPTPTPAPEPTGSPGLLKKSMAAGFDFGDVVFVRLGASDKSPGTVYMRCTAVSLPDDSGDFTVKDPDGVNLTLNVRDKIAPFRDNTPTFGVARVEGREMPQGPGKNDGAKSPQAKPVNDPNRVATIPELRAELVKRQNGCPTKSVNFSTSIADDHSHVARVDRMGYGTTIKDSTGHTHTVNKWVVLSAFNVAGHDAEHRLTLAPPSL